MKEQCLEITSTSEQARNPFTNGMVVHFGGAMHETQTNEINHSADYSRWGVYMGPYYFLPKEEECSCPFWNE